MATTIGDCGRLPFVHLNLVNTVLITNSLVDNFGMSLKVMTTLFSQDLLAALVAWYASKKTLSILGAVVTSAIFLATVLGWVLYASCSPEVRSSGATP